LDHHRQGLRELARRGCQVTEELVRAFTDHPATLKILENTLQKLRLPQQLQRLVLLLLRELALRRYLARFLPLFQKFLELQQHLAEVVLDHLLLDQKLVARELRKMRSLPRRIQLQRVHVEGAPFARAEQVHAQRAGWRLARQPAHAPPPIAKLKTHLVAIRREWLVRWSRARRRWHGIVRNALPKLIR
jgi:hypothetical protein